MAIDPARGGRYKTIAVTVSNEEFDRFQRWMDKQHDAGMTRSTGARQLLLMALSQVEAGEVPDVMLAPLEAAEAQMGATLGVSFLVSNLLPMLVSKGVFTADDVAALHKLTHLSLEKAKAGDAVRNGALWDEARRRVDDLVGRK
jgi:hypothetical protein